MSNKLPKKSIFMKLQKASSSHWYMHESYLIREVLKVADSWNNTSDMRTLLSWLRNGFADENIIIKGIGDFTKYHEKNDLNLWIDTYGSLLECDISSIPKPKWFLKRHIMKDNNNLSPYHALKDQFELVKYATTGERRELYIGWYYSRRSQRLKYNKEHLPQIKIKDIYYQIK